ncbi:uncharacterized protein SOCE26_003240 [Sorangium cellulosum]|uniref:Peptidase M10 metallopeptidase domain-containing protein n=1 Tax=Sorangium cellulosum TaxID=56 RepID=A0A2L0EI23_SORCE|nr:hypothetical protein [Sorangium cellulosum]AUX38943.1 uncharacterized protein SOCE26_003240 [Sorangium cellulosum]
MTDFNIILRDPHRVRPTDVLIRTVTEAFEGLAEEAGRPLNVVAGSPMSGAPLDDQLAITFVGNRLRLGERFIGGSNIGLILGDEGGAAVYVGALLEMRVGGGPRGVLVPSRYRGGSPLDREPARLEIDYMSQTEPVFENGEPELARAAGNVAAHELGHMLARLGHELDLGNYMADGSAFLRRFPSPTRRDLRWFWSGRKSWDPAQRQRLVRVIRSGRIEGGLQAIPGG